jgi:hypothetical protein
MIDVGNLCNARPLTSPNWFSHPLPLIVLRPTTLLPIQSTARRMDVHSLSLISRPIPIVANGWVFVVTENLVLGPVVGRTYELSSSTDRPAGLPSTSLPHPVTLS